MKTKKPMREVRTISTTVEVNSDASTVQGYFAIFNSRSLDLGGFVEVIEPGAFSKTLTDSPDVLCLCDHDPRKLLGRTTSGTLQVAEDGKGLAFTVKLPNTSYANDLRSLMSRGDISQCSFGFIVIEDDWYQDETGITVRTIKRVRLLEGSIVCQPAYPSTSAQLRSLFPDGIPEEVAKHQTRSTDDEDIPCTCPCVECKSGKCEDCSDPDCDCEGCDCEQAEEDRSAFITEEERQILLLHLEIARL